MSQTRVEINYLKGYALFLLQNHLTDLAQEEMFSKKDLDQPLLHWLRHLSDEEFSKILEARLRGFLMNLSEGKGEEDIEEGMKAWRSDNLIEINKLHITPTDLAIEYGARKKALLKFLPLYTKDLDLALKIIDEIIDYYTRREKAGIQAFTDIQRDEFDRILDGRKMAEKKLKDSQRMAEMGSWEMEPSTGISKWSDELHEIFGISKKESVELDELAGIIAKKDLPQILHNINNARKFGTQYSHEYEVIRPDGEHRILRTRAVPTVDENGRVVIINGITQDITKLKETEKQLRRSQELIDQVTRTSPFIILVFEIETGKIIYINEAAFDQVAISQEELTEKGYAAIKGIVHPDDWSRLVNRRLNYAKQTDAEESTLEFRVKDRSGIWRWYYSKAVVFRRDDEGNVSQVLSTASNIDKLKTAEEKLKENRNFIQKIMETTPNILYVYDINEGKNVYANRAVDEVLGYSPGGLKSLGKNVLATFLHPDDLPLIVDYFNNFVNAKEGEIRSLTYRLRDAEGRWRWYISKETVFAWDKNGVPYQVMGVIQDISDRVEAEDALKYREAQLVEAQEIAHVGSFDWDLTTKLVKGTREFFNIYRIQSDDGTIDSEKIFNLMPAEDAGRIKEGIEHSISRNEMFEGEYKILLEEGVRNVFSRGKLIKDSNGKIIRMIGTILDITDIKQAEAELKRKNEELVLAYESLENAQEELRSINNQLEYRVEVRTAELAESEEKYRAFVAQSQEGIWRYELREIKGIDVKAPRDEQVEKIIKFGYIAESNDKMAQMYGFSSNKDFIGKNLDIIIDVTDVRIRNLMKRFVESGYKLENFITHGRGQDGKIKYFSSNLLGIIENGTLVRAWSTQIDITRAKLAEKAMKASEERYRFLAETVPQLFWASNPEGIVEYYNQNWYNYTGRQFDVSMKWSWISAVFEDDREACILKLKESLDAASLFEIECRLIKNDKSVSWHLARALPLKADGEVKKWFGTFTDINERKTIEENLRIKNEELIKINQDLDNFIYTASHDLKAPISNIEGLLLTIGDTLDPVNCKDKEISELFDMMDRSILRFKRTIHDLTEITRAQKSTEEEEQEVSLSQVYDDVVSSIEDLINTAHASFEVDFSISSIRFSRKGMRSIFYNLISNAIKYRYPGRPPVIRIKAERIESWNVVTFSDNGLGISEANREKVFSMFKRLHDHVEGSGVGLYIVKRIVTNAGGKIELDSEIDKGTTFRIFLK